MDRKLIHDTLDSCLLPTSAPRAGPFICHCLQRWLGATWGLEGPTLDTSLSGANLPILSRLAWSCCSQKWASPGFPGPGPPPHVTAHDCHLLDSFCHRQEVWSPSSPLPFLPVSPRLPHPPPVPPDPACRSPPAPWPPFTETGSPASQVQSLTGLAPQMTVTHACGDPASVGHAAHKLVPL